MSASTELARALLGALAGVPGLGPATPIRSAAGSWASWDWDLMAVDVHHDRVHVRLIATQLPLPPLLERANTVLRTVMDAHHQQDVALRLEVTDIDGIAFTAPRSM